MPEQRRRFDREFKYEAVRLATRGDKTLTQFTHGLCPLRTKWLYPDYKQMEDQFE